MSKRFQEHWEEEFDKEFQGGIFTHDKGADVYSIQTDSVKKFISYLLKKRRHTEEQEASKLSLEDRYAWERSRLFSQAQKTAHMMADLVKQYLEEHHPELDFRIETYVPKRYDVTDDIMLIDTFELVLNVIFPKLSMSENIKMLYEVESYLHKHGMQYMSPYVQAGDMKVLLGTGKKEE